MEVKLNSNSWVYRLYNWFYDRNSGSPSRPTNLCPYFWSLVFMFIVIIPYSLFIVLGAPIHKFEQDTHERRLVQSFVLGFGYCILFSILAAIYALIFDHSLIANDASIIGVSVIFGLAFLITGAFFAIGYGIQRIINCFPNKTQRQNTDNILISFIKSKYKKICPSITWIDNTKDHE